MKLIFLVFYLFILQCTTTPGVSPGTAESCYCGPTNPEKPTSCAVWDRKASLSERTPFLKVSSGKCSKTKCATIAEGICGTVAEFTYNPPNYAKKDIKSPCFCDEVVITLDDDIFRVCAAWQGQDKHLIEYFDTKNCNPSTCSKPPFVKAKEICTLGFTAFYKPESPRQ